MPKRPASFKPRHAANHADSERARKAKLDKARGNAGARGYGADWQRFRAEVLRDQPFCIQCGSDDRLNVDHIESVRENPDRRLDRGNVRVLCHSCHSARTARDQGFGLAARRIT